MGSTNYYLILSYSGYVYPYVYTLDSMYLHMYVCCMYVSFVHSLSFILFPFPYDGCMYVVCLLLLFLNKSISYVLVAPNVVWVWYSPMYEPPGVCFIGICARVWYNRTVRLVTVFLRESCHVKQRPVREQGH